MILMQVPVGLQQLRRVHQNRAIKSNVKIEFSIHIPYWYYYRNYVRGWSEWKSEWRVTQLTGDNSEHSSSSDSFIALLNTASSAARRRVVQFSVRFWLKQEMRKLLPQPSKLTSFYQVSSKIVPVVLSWSKSGWQHSSFSVWERLTGHCPDRVWRHPAADSDSCKCTDTNSETIRTFSVVTAQAHLAMWANAMPKFTAVQLARASKNIKFVYEVDTWPMYRQLRQHQHASICFKELHWVHSVYFKACLSCSNMMYSRKVRSTFCECAIRAQMEGGDLRKWTFSEDGKAW